MIRHAHGATDGNAEGTASSALPGVFVAVVGASGTGKDTLLSGVRARLAGNPNFVFPRRIITRTADRHEDNIAATEAEFSAMQAVGAFALHWQANGFRYGLPASIRDALDEGRHVVTNISRLSVPELRQRFSSSLVVEIRVRPDILAARLAGRGRETAAEQKARFERSATVAPGLAPDIGIDNNGDPKEAIDRLFDVLIGLGTPSLSQGQP